MKWMLIALCAVVFLAGCATNGAARPEAHGDPDHDAKSVRALVDTMSSPAHNFPANIPR